ncbi:MAG: hypothetical protein JNL51_03090 [Chitinophagaceae bacterium]|nr:hypothetical protein [Chitinophagaceae bacterium]
MRKDLLTKLNLRELDPAEYASITGGNAVADHLRCVRDAYMNSPAKTVLLGGTIWGIVRTLGIIVGCAG